MIKHRLNSVLKSQGLRQSAMMAVGNVGASGFSAVSLIILSRFLGPQSFGGFSVAFSLTQLIARIADLGSGLALQQFVAAHHKDNPHDSSYAIMRIGIYKLAIAAFSVIAGFVSGQILAEKVFHVSDPTLITLGVVMAAIIILYEYVLAIAQALSKFVLAVIMNASQAVVKCSMAIISFFFLSPSPVIAYMWYGLAPLIAVAIGGLSIKQWFVSKGTNQKIDSELFRIAKFGAISVIALAIGDNVDVLMVNSSLNEYETGLYAAASRIALMAIMFGSSFGTVFNIRVAKYRNSKDLKSFLKKSTYFALGSLALIPLVLLLSKPLLILTAGPQYAEAVTVLNYLMAASFLFMAVMPFIAVFYAVDFPMYFAVAGVLQTIVIIAFNAVLIPMVGIEGAGVAKLIARSAVFIYTVIAAFTYAHIQYNTGHPLTLVKQLFQRQKPIIQQLPPIQ